MSSSLPLPPPEAPFTIRHTNVSNPSIVRSQPSQQSFSASEDYYSLSSSLSSGNSDLIPNTASVHTITRFQTPPSRYRTPQQSRDNLHNRSRDDLSRKAQHATVEEDEEFRKTPMRGEGKRRSSVPDLDATPTASSAIRHPSPSQQRFSGVKRKPVPSVIMDSTDPSKRESRISPTFAESSAAKDINRESDAPTPGVDDTPYVHFALDQLTRDEEVRGSRLYPGTGVGGHGSYPAAWPLRSEHHYESVPQEEEKRQMSFDQVPPRNPQRLADPLHPQSQAETRARGTNVFIAVEETQYSKLNFLPGILRPLSLAIFLGLVVLFLACLIFTAVWSRVNTTIWAYGRFGDARYFVFRYLPTILAMILLMWLFQIEIALYRIAPFIAMASSSPRDRLAGAKLPLVPHGFLLPYLKHFTAGQPMISAFLSISWLQLFTVPLLASSFNTYQQATWRWLAVQYLIWVAVGLYILLVIATVALLVWLSRTTTGLKWDPRSLADLVVLLERSNALDGEGESVPRLGLWRTSHRPNEIFHAYGVEGKPARSYAIQDGQIREKRYSPPEMDIEAGQPPRTSKDAILGKDSNSNVLDSRPTRGAALPWFLRPFFALLWPIIAIVLLLAFLIISYLPSTKVANGFDPLLPSFVDRNGYSASNFLYSFLPSLLGMFLLLFWLSIDLAHRRLQPFASLTALHTSRGSDHPDLLGDTAERTLLPSYPFDLRFLATLTAAINGHWRPALTSFITLIAATLPVLAGGVFWALFYPSTQTIRMTAQMPAYYALTVFLSLYAMAYLAIYPPSDLRSSTLPSDINTFAGVSALFAQSRMLDDVAFRAPGRKVDLVTRLLSSSSSITGNYRRGYPSCLGNEDVEGMMTEEESRRRRNGSLVSLKDSLRGFGGARGRRYGTLHMTGGREQGEEKGRKWERRVGFGRWVGRDGGMFEGVDWER